MSWLGGLELSTLGWVCSTQPSLGVWQGQGEQAQAQSTLVGEGTEEGPARVWWCDMPGRGVPELREGSRLGWEAVQAGPGGWARPKSVYA